MSGWRAEGLPGVQTKVEPAIVVMGLHNPLVTLWVVTERDTRRTYQVYQWNKLDCALDICMIPDALAVRLMHKSPKRSEHYVSSK
jgi:hypothetical protein